MSPHKTPSDTTQLRSFIGLCNYYRRFIRDFAHIATPLNKLLQQDEKFTWSNECQQAFDYLKNALTSEPIMLPFPDFSKEFILYTDASNFSIGYILGQKDQDNREHVISYAGRSLQPGERRWGITDKECLAVIEGVKHFHVYLSGRKFQIYTDHSALKWLQTRKADNGRLGRWSLLLQDYNYEVIHIPGRKHGNADCLSRIQYNQEHPEGIPSIPAKPSVEPAIPDNALELMNLETIDGNASGPSEDGWLEYHLTYTTYQTQEGPQLNTITSINTVQTLNQAEQNFYSEEPTKLLNSIMAVETITLKDYQRLDDELKLYIEYLEDGKLPEDEKFKNKILSGKSHYVLDDQGILHFFITLPGKGHQNERQIRTLAVPKTLRKDVMMSFHDCLLGGHEGFDRSYNKIRMKYYWPGMYADIQKYVKTCQSCQESKPNQHSHPAPLQPIPPADVLSRVHIDILGPVTKTKEGYRYILLIVDSFTKWCEAFPMKTMEATEVADILYRDFITRFGAPEILVSDQGRNFIGKLIQNLCKIFQITKVQTSSYHPQSNATCERMNKVIAHGIKHHIDETQSNWPMLLPGIMMAYRTTPATESHQYSPYYLLFGRECRMPLDIALMPRTGNKNVDSYLQEMIENKEVAAEIARENILKSQVKYKGQHDKKAKVPKYQLGNQVWLYCNRTPIGLSPKFYKHWVGPYYICKVFPNYTYKLRRSSDNKPVKSLIHANRLKPHSGGEDRPADPPIMFQNDNLERNPEELQDNIRTFTHQQDFTIQEDNIPNSSQGTQPSQTVQSEFKYVVERVLACKKYQNGEVWYKVHLQGVRGPRLIQDKNLPQAMIREFHINKTMVGKKRKLGNKNYPFKYQPSQ